MDNLYLALIHHPVTNRKQDVIGSALTTIDLHDISRAAMTYGAGGVFIVTPYEDQQQLARDIIDHWTRGAGGQINPDRKAALSMIDVTASFEAAVEKIEMAWPSPVTRIATSARYHEGAIPVSTLKAGLDNDNAHIMAFGTAWGLTDTFVQDCDIVLAPITGHGEYNHLSVRSAVSIFLDRICNS